MTITPHVANIKRVQKISAVKYQYGSTYHMERVKDCKKTITDK
jgi:hypothetical protein